MTVNLGYMQTPAAGKRLPMLHRTNAQWAADTGCYRQGDSFDLGAYLRWLEALRPVQVRCLFATAPDVVGDAAATWVRSRDVLPLIRGLGYRAALVAQDGLEEMEVEWDSFDCLFVGGTTAWKLSAPAFTLARQAKGHGKWVHMGRVNSRKRLLLAAVSGYDSADGTTVAFAPDKRLEQWSRWLKEVQLQSRFVV